jgi:hypothetical protein
MDDPIAGLAPLLESPERTGSQAKPRRWKGLLVNTVAAGQAGA